jgi:hypothetical protein
VVSAHIEDRESVSEEQVFAAWINDLHRVNQIRQASLAPGYSVFAAGFDHFLAPVKAVCSHMMPQVSFARRLIN